MDYTADAQTFINRHKLNGTVMTDSLGEDLARQAFSRMNVVVKVFDVLSDTTDRFYAGMKMVEFLGDAALLNFAKYKEGNALLNAVNNCFGAFSR